MSGRRGSYTDGARGKRGAHMGTASKRPRGYKAGKRPTVYRDIASRIIAPDDRPCFTPRGITATPEQRLLALYG